jgi:hypothetical protein
MFVFRNSVPVLLALVLWSVPAWSAGYLYRYTNDQGIIEIGHAVPPQYVHKGYEELNPDGTVNRVIKPALTAEERANRSQDVVLQERAEERAERLREYDESLMLRYSSVADIEAARDRALGELKIRISILRSNVRSLKQQVEGNQARAADIERSGGKVPVAIVEAIEGLRGEIVEAERAIVIRSKEMEVVNAGYKRDMDRFAKLEDLVNLRQRSQVPNVPD